MSNQTQDDPSSSEQNQQPTTTVEDLTPEPENNQPALPDTNESPSTNSNSSDDQTEEQLQVHIKNPIYREETSPFTLTLPSNTTIGQLKQRLSTDYPGKPSPERQRLIYGGRILSDAIPLSTAISPSVRELYSRHTLHLVVRNDEHANPSPRTPPRPINTNANPPNAPRLTRITRLPPSVAHNPPSSNLTYAQRLSLMHGLLARMIQLDHNAASTNGIVPGSRQHEDQRMLIRQTVTESVNLVRQIEQHAQVLRFLLYVPDFYNQFQATTYPVDGRGVLQLPHWMEPITTPWQQDMHGLQPHDQFPFTANMPQQPPQNFPPPHAPNTFGGFMNFNNALARFRQMEANEPQQNQNPIDSHFQQHAQHMHHHHGQPHVHSNEHQHPQGAGPDPVHQQQPQQPRQPAPQPNPDPVPQQQPDGEMPMNANDFRQLMMDNLAAMMQQNGLGNAPGEPAPPAPVPEAPNGNANLNINANPNDPNAPVVRQFVFQFEIDWSLIFKLLLLIYLFAQGGTPRRVYSLGAVAVAVYLWHRGYLTFLGRLLRAALPSPRNVVDSLFPIRQEGTDDQPVVREQSRFGRLSLVFTFVYAFVYGFLCSLLPGWNPERIPRADEIIPPGPNPMQQQQDNQEGNQGDAAIHAHAD